MARGPQRALGLLLQRQHARTALGGDDIYRQELSANGLLVMGNEGSGVSPEVMSRVKKSLLIPSYSLSGGIDSLNVAIATAVACAEFKRRLG